MEPIATLRALSRAAPALTGSHPDAGTLADELDLTNHAACYDLMEPVLAAGWARVTNARADEWDQWAVTSRGRHALSTGGVKK